MGPWLVDVESLEQLSQDDISRQVVLCLAQLSREGRLAPLVVEVTQDPEFDEETRNAIRQAGGG